MSGLTLRGRIACREVLEGSRSQHEAPVLEDEEGNLHRLHLIGDNPFEQPGLRRLEGRRVRVSGVWRNGVLRVEAEGLEVEEGDPLRAPRQRQR